MKVNCEVAFLWEKEKRTLDSQLAPLSSVAAALTLKSPRRDGKEKKIEGTLFYTDFSFFFSRSGTSRTWPSPAGAPTPPPPPGW